MPPNAPPPKRRKLSAVTEDETSHERVEGISGAKRIKKNSAWTGLEAALQGLRISSSSFPTLQSAIGTLTTCLEVFEQASTHKDEYEALALELESVVTSLKHHLNIPRSARVLGVISSVSRAIEKEVHLISGIRDEGSTRRILRASKDEEVLVRVYRRIAELFSRLQIEIGMDAWSISNEHLANTRLEALNPSKQARCDSNLGDKIGRRQCTEGTQESLLADLYQWSDSLDDKPVYLMNGIAGTGKTTIAYSLTKLLEDDSRLGASFFCTRAAPSCKDASRIIPSIAYQLARYSTAFQSALCLVLDADPDLGSRNMTTQFKWLLKEPLLQVKDKIPKHTVVVLDSLDECDNLKATRLLFDLIIRSACELPIKFFAASRPESRIQLMSSQVNDIVHISHLHEIESSLVKRDLEVYLHEELVCIKPSQQQINQLAESANNLFVYAATAVRYIRSDEAGVYSNERLFTILNETKYTSKKFSEIDELYTTILTSALENKRLEPEEATRTQALLKTATCIKEPVTIETLASLAGLDDSSYAFVALDPLRSVLHVSRHTGLVFVFHASFSDYLFHRERSGRFFCDKVEQHIAMAHICFELMEKQLRLNICELRSSYIFDCAVADLEQRIESNISTSLTYSCQHWANHLCLVPISNHLYTVLHEFLTRRLLFWMEVLNLKEYRIFNIRSITDVQRWIASSDAFEDLTLFIHDTVVFVLQFFTSTHYGK